jgi:hypothetical protein
VKEWGVTSLLVSTLTSSPVGVLTGNEIGFAFAVVELAKQHGYPLY